ncbi:MAG: contractile injection system protein, VgrG/Pvc8 family [Polyangiaceae bacterium]|nr:contractile injection system protein, VgrG/Pvc8 family [Polyangiaceae bacterium]
MNTLTFGLAGAIPGFPKLPGQSQSSIKDPFELVAGPFVSHELRVVAFHGEERINDIFEYNVTFATSVPAEELYPAVDGEPACLTIKAPGHEPRIIQGIVVAFEPLGHISTQSESETLAYNLTIVPRLWLLKNQRRNRAFQDRTPQQIIEEVLADSGIQSTYCNWRIRPTDYAPLPFVLQREETDYEFFCRVLADAGIFFYFEHASGTLDTMLAGAGGIAGMMAGAASQVGGAPGAAMGVLGKAAKMLTMLNFGDEPGHVVAVAPMAAANQAIGQAAKEILDPLKGPFPPASFWDAEPCDTLQVDDGHGAQTDEECIYRFGLRKAIRPKSVRLLEWDVKASLPWEKAAKMDPFDLTLKPKIGVSMGPGGPKVKANVDFGLDIDSPTIKASYLQEDFYQLDTLLRAYPKPEQRAKRELERLRRDYLVGRGQSDCRRLGAGYRFRVGSHPVKGLNIEYTVTELLSDGVHPDFAGETHPVYRNTFACIPSKFAPRPPRPDKRPKLGLELATVVDLGAETVTPTLNTNECAYVHVKFKWDIYDDARIRDSIAYSSQQKPHSHTAIRVPVLQAWAGNGYGCQFIPREGMDVLIGFLGGQGERPVVLGCLYSERNVLPNGGNKYQLQNAIQHQRTGIVTKTRPTNGNWSEITLDDHRGHEVINVRAARDLNEEVLHDETVHVGNDKREDVDNNAQIEIGNDASVEVGNNRATHIGSNESLAVDGDRSTTVDGDVSEDVGGDAEVNVTGNVEATFENDVTERVFGDKVVVVGSGADDEKEPAPSLDISVDGQLRTFSKKRTEVVAEEGIAFRCGDSRIHLKKDGILLEGPKIVLRGGDVSMSGDKFSTAFENAKLTADEVTVASGEASLKLTSEATLQGSKVHLGSGGGDKEKADDLKYDSPQSEKEPKSQVLVHLHSHSGCHPLANRPYRISGPGLEGQEGVTDDKGLVELHQILAGDYLIEVDGIKEWVHSRPEGSPALEHRVGNFVLFGDDEQSDDEQSTEQ